LPALSGPRSIGGSCYEGGTVAVLNRCNLLSQRQLDHVLLVYEEVDDWSSDEVGDPAGAHLVDIDPAFPARDIERAAQEDVAVEAEYADFARGLGIASQTEVESKVLDRHVAVFEVLGTVRGGLIFRNHQLDVLIARQRVSELLPALDKRLPGAGSWLVVSVHAGLRRAREGQIAAQGNAGNGEEQESRDGQRGQPQDAAQGG
jgi:hypothetical protein